MATLGTLTVTGVHISSDMIYKIGPMRETYNGDFIYPITHRVLGGLNEKNGILKAQLFAL